MVLTDEPHGGLKLSKFHLSWRSLSDCAGVAHLQVAYLTKKLQAARADSAAAEEARQKLAQRDHDISATLSDMHRDMAGHVARRNSCAQCITSTFFFPSTLMPALSWPTSGAMLRMHLHACN